MTAQRDTAIPILRNARRKRCNAVRALLSQSAGARVPLELLGHIGDATTRRQRQWRESRVGALPLHSGEAERGVARVDMDVGARDEPACRFIEVQGGGRGTRD